MDPFGDAPVDPKQKLRDSNYTFASTKTNQSTLQNDNPLVFAAGPAPSEFQEGPEVLSVLGLDRRDRSRLSLDDIIQGSRVNAESLDQRSSSLNISYREMLTKVYDEAQIPGRDVGRDLLKILPDLIREPELLERLYSVATAEALLSVEVSADRRREFLSEVIIAAADRMSINQGHTSFCTVTDQLGDTSLSNRIKLMCDLALDCQAESQSGVLILAGKGADPSSQERDLRERIIPYMEGKVGQSITSDGVSPLQLQQLGARQPGVIFSTVLACLMEINGQDVTRSEGQKWMDFTTTRQVIKGHAVVCAAYDAKIPVDKDGKPVWCHSGDGLRNFAVKGDREVSLIDYVDLALERKASEGAASAIGGIGVNMRWSDAQYDPNRSSQHACHTQSIIGKKLDAEGNVWYVLDNPVGNYYKPTKLGEPPRCYPPGTELGNKNGTWWKVGEQTGTVEVRADVLKESLIHLMVDHPDRPLDHRSTNDIQVYTLGSVNGEIAKGIKTVDLVTHEPRLADRVSTTTTTQRSELMRQDRSRPRVRTVGEQLAEEALAKRLLALKENSAAPFTYHRGNAGYRDPAEIVSGLGGDSSLADTSAKARRIVGSRGDEPFILGFSQNIPNGSSKVVSNSVPPPPPTRSPEELARDNRRQSFVAAV